MAEASDFRGASGAQVSCPYRPRWNLEETPMFPGWAKHRWRLRQRLQAQSVVQGEAKGGAHCRRAEAPRCNQEGLRHSPGACANMHSGWNYYSPVRCPIWAHGLLFYNSCIYVGYCDVVVLLCTLLCCSSSWCHVCPCLAFVLFSLYVSQLFCCISIVHTRTWLSMFFYNIKLDP